MKRDNFFNKFSAARKDKGEHKVQFGVLNAFSTPKTTSVARSGDIPANEKLAILSMLKEDK